ncbi:MAG: hypothetical protein OXF88_18465 [Rhodobacteraceae bacterium]|nr:hypothetical protein [Paracoccaceae bacterium]
MDGQGRAADAFDAGPDRLVRLRPDARRRRGWKPDPTGAWYGHAARPALI